MGIWGPPFAPHPTAREGLQSTPFPPPPRLPRALGEASMPAPTKSSSWIQFGVRVPILPCCFHLLQGNKEALIPWADFLNHSPSTSSHIDWDGDGFDNCLQEHWARWGGG